MKITLASATLLLLSACAGVDGNSAIEFRGEITPASVGSFLNKYSEHPPRTIVLNSGGGDVGAAIELAEWIFENQMDVVVSGVCASSCANYLFPAGRTKKIIPPAIVFWHGSALQKNIREKQEVLEKALAASASVGARDEKMLNDYNSINTLQIRQAAFYRRVRVSEYVTRAGQEPRRLGSNWTIETKDLAMFGICNVTAAADYGSDRYIKRWEATLSHMPGVKLLALDAGHATMLAHEIRKLDYRINDCG